MGRRNDYHWRILLIITFVEDGCRIGVIGQLTDGDAERYPFIFPFAVGVGISFEAWVFIGNQLI